MTKEIKKIIAILLLGLGTTYMAKAQIVAQKIGKNSTMKAPSAVLEIEHTSKGVLFPRVALSSLEDNITVPNPVHALTVFNTTTAGMAPNEVMPGYYFWNETTQKWMKLLNQGDASSGSPWNKQETTSTAISNTENIYQMGSVAIGTVRALPIVIGSTRIQPKLYIQGDVSTTGKYYTTNSMYADYVFEKYFKGSSTINDAYEFKSLAYVKEFIQKNNHLPGVTPIGDLSKSKTGYTFDLTELTIQSLEKIEELYLHTLEQQEEIMKQRAEIELLLKEMLEMKERVGQLESR